MLKRNCKESTVFTKTAILANEPLRWCRENIHNHWTIPLKKTIVPLKNQILILGLWESHKFCLHRATLSLKFKKKMHNCHHKSGWTTKIKRKTAKYYVMGETLQPISQKNQLNLERKWGRLLIKFIRCILSRRYSPKSFAIIRRTISKNN